PWREKGSNGYDFDLNTGWINRYNWLTHKEIRYWRGLEQTQVLIFFNKLVLSLPRNRLKGELPKNFGDRLSQFEVKDIGLNYNEISGILPVQLKDFQYVVLNNNEFVGKIPIEIFESQTITDLLLNNNKFHGKFPINVNISNSKISIISLGSNNLYGNIPKWITEYYLLKRFWGVSGYFSGELPSEIFILPYIEDLTFENNYLTKINIPDSVSSTLRVIFFFENNLTGEIKLPNLESFLFTGNFLETIEGLENLFTNKFNISNNFLGFQSLSNIPLQNIHLTYLYQNQRDFGKIKKITSTDGESFIYNLGIDNNITKNQYIWYKYGNNSVIFQSNINKLVIDNMTVDKEGIYYCLVTNPNLPTVTLRSRPILIEISPCAVPQSEIDILFELKNTNGGAATQDWSLDINTDINQWQGVTVENCHVIGIELPNSGLTGILPASLCNLEYLESVDFSGNPGLLPPVPPCVCELMNLYSEVTIFNQNATSPICPGGFITLSASINNANSADFIFRWYNPSNILIKNAIGDSTLVLTNVTSSSLGEYRVEVEALTTFSCGGSATYMLESSIFQQLPVITLEGGGQICPGGSITLKATIQGSNPANFIYRWYSPSGILLKTAVGDPFIELNNVTNSSLGTYRVDVENFNLLPCGSGEYLLNSSIFYPLPAVTVKNILHTTCPNSADGEATVTVAGTESLYSYNVYSSNGNIVANAVNIASGADFIVTGLPAGNYIIKGVTNDGCEFRGSFEIKNGGPVVEFCIPPLPCDIQIGKTIVIPIQFKITRLRPTGLPTIGYRIYNITNMNPPPFSNATYNTWTTYSLIYKIGEEHIIQLNECNIILPLEFAPLNISISGIRSAYRRCYPLQPLAIKGYLNLGFPECLDADYQLDNLVSQLYSVSSAGQLTFIKDVPVNFDLSIDLTNFTYPAGNYFYRIFTDVVNYGSCHAERYFTV
ncbi:MAG: hypothetical protein FWC41_11980, partial [Firmicutes bacterium]|nr:hypothetical protein [Bacillota bacterium]